MNPLHSEFSIQNKLFSYCERKQHEFIFPNVSMAHWEADMISVTRAGYLHEYEIKTSRSDYKADFNKVTKHLWLGHEGKRRTTAPPGAPAYFWYVAPEGIIDFVPCYAGLMEIDAGDSLLERVGAPRLHSIKIGQFQKEQIYRSAQWKLWNARRAMENLMIQRRLFRHIMRQL